MDDLTKRYQSLSNEELVTIVDSKGHTPEARETAFQVLQKQNVLPVSLHKIAEENWTNYCRENFRTIIKNGEKLESRFLSNEEIRTIIQDTYDYFKERQELFEIDLTKYWGIVF